MSASDERRRRRRHLSTEDRALWDLVAQRVHPLPGRATAAGAHREPSPNAEPPLEHRPVTEPSPPRSVAAKPTAPSVPRPARPLPIPRPPSAPQAAETSLDHKTVRRVARGREPIDARIDLHGMRQHEAHSALRGFLFGAFAKGHRTVLVITGKGRSDRDDASGWDDRGVLKRVVPAWLAAVDVRSVVIGFTEAHARHGGAGAFYVKLRSKAKPPGG